MVLDKKQHRKSVGCFALAVIFLSLSEITTATMYQLDVSAFGDYKQYAVQNESSNNGFTIVPDVGACMLDLRFAGKSVLDGYTTPEELQENKWAKNVVLYPFPNRLKQGKYEWAGKQYQFPVNDPATGNALHGLGMQAPLRVENIEMTEHYAKITCIGQRAGDEEAYPFAYTFSVAFKMKEPGYFTCEMTFVNDDQQPIPVGFGWHPYFKLAEKVDDLELKVPACEEILIDDKMLPTGKRRAFPPFEELARIGKTNLDNCFVLKAAAGREEVRLQNGAQQLYFWQEAGEGKFNYLQLFIPPGRQSIAIEPMTCNINAFNNGEGLIILEPGAQASAQFGFSLNSILQ